MCIRDRKWSCRLQKSQNSQDKNLTLISQKKLAGIETLFFYSLSARFKPWYHSWPYVPESTTINLYLKLVIFLPYKSWTSNFLGCFKLERPLLVSWPYLIICCRYDNVCANIREYLLNCCVVIELTEGKTDYIIKLLCNVFLKVAFTCLLPVLFWSLYVRRRGGGEGGGRFS